MNDKATTETQETTQTARPLLSGKLAVSEAMVLKAVYESGLHQYAPGVLRTSWKDGIDLDVPCPALINFARKICMAANVI